MVSTDGDGGRVGTMQLISTEAKEGDAPTREEPATPLLSSIRDGRLESNREDGDAEPKEFDIPEDAYGAAILAICKNLPDLVRGEDRSLNLFMVIFSISINTLNLVLQFSVVYFISSNVVSPKVSEVQLKYKDFHRNVFHEGGIFDEHLWDAYDAKDELCQIAMTNRAFYAMTLFLWVVTMMREFLSCQRLFANVSSVPGCSHSDEMLERVVDAAEIKTYIVKVTLPVRIALYSLVCIPKLAICLALMWLGCSWLSATTKFEDLVLNAVAMSFVTDIDSMLYDVLIPADYQKEVADINFKLPSVKGSSGELRRQGLWDGFKRSLFVFAISIMYLIVYVNYLQNVLPASIEDVKEHCTAFLAIEAEPHCGNGILENLWAVFENGSVTAACYPYGK